MRNDYKNLAEFFKLFSNENRLKIISALSTEELSVSQIEACTSLSQSLVSQQLKLLSNARIVSKRREGKAVYYSLFDRHILHLLKDVAVHLAEGVDND